jgi:Helix-turn-helix domain
MGSARKKHSAPRKKRKLLPKSLEELGTASVATLQEVASILRISPQQVSNLIDERLLLAIDVSCVGRKHCYRIPVESVRAFIASQKKKAGLW